MLNTLNPLQQQVKQPNQAELAQQQFVGQAQSLLKRCKEGEADACYTLRDSEMGAKLKQHGYMAEGGEAESLLTHPAMMDEADEYGVEEYEEESFDEQPDEWVGLREVLGEEAFMQLEEAILHYPVIEDIARMAIKTRDGYVEGEGGPKDDQVPALLSDGEFVISAEAVEVIGLDKLEKMHEDAKAAAASLR